MESNWRRNVADLGAVGTGYVLMARVLSGPYADGYLCETVFNSVLKTYVFPVVFDGVLSFTVAETIFSDEPFPCGIDVEPD